MTQASTLKKILEELNPPAEMLMLLHENLRSWLLKKQNSGILTNQHVSLPSGNEQGIFAVIDFGGSNLRAGIVALDGKRGFQVLHSESAPLRCSNYDMTKATVTSDELFAFSANIVAKALNATLSSGCISGQTNLALGHVFSFPCLQTEINSAKLLKWTKEIKTEGVVGHDVQQLLADSLQKKQLNICPRAVLNDTTAVLLAGQYQYGHTALAGILGTGHNFGGFIVSNPQEKIEEKKSFAAHNFESGDFTNIPAAILTSLDTELDSTSDAPQEQLLEKMVGGAYLGELGRLAFIGAAKEIPELQLLDFLSTAYALSTSELAMIADCQDNIEHIKTWLLRHMSGTPSLRACQSAAAIADVIIRRAARITATEIAAFLSCDILIKYENAPSLVALEGSLYLKIEFFKRCLFEALQDEFGVSNARDRIINMPDAVFAGAAVAACMGAN